jgi:hypothetical protein
MPKAKLSEPPTSSVHTIEPNGLYAVRNAYRVLGLTKTTLRREIRAGRLRVAERGGRHFVLGRWLLEWLEGGEVTRYREVAADGLVGKGVQA